MTHTHKGGQINIGEAQVTLIQAFPNSWVFDFATLMCFNVVFWCNCIMSQFLFWNLREWSERRRRDAADKREKEEKAPFFSLTSFPSICLTPDKTPALQNCSLFSFPCNSCPWFSLWKCGHPVLCKLIAKVLRRKQSFWFNPSLSSLQPF